MDEAATRRLRGSAIAAMLAVATVTAAAPPALAAQVSGEITPAQLAQVCEESFPAPVEVVRETVVTGSSSSDRHAVVTGCTFELADGVKLEFKSVGMDFAGPLSFVRAPGARSNALIATSTSLNATALTAELTGASGLAVLRFSQFRADPGDIDIALGDFGKLEVTGALDTQSNVAVPALDARGALEVSAGESFSAALSTRLDGDLGITFDLPGADSILKANGQITTSGPFRVLAPGDRSVIEFFHTLRVFAGSIEIAATGTVATFRGDGSFMVAGAGDLTLTAGDGADLGKIEVRNSRLEAAEDVRVLASSMGQTGVLSVLDSAVFAGSANDIVMETGAAGDTLVEAVRFLTGFRVRIATGPGGRCSVRDLSINPPVQEICP